MLFSLKYILLLLLILNLRVFNSFLYSKAHDSFVSNKQLEEAQSMIDHAKQTIKPYKAEVLSQTSEAKARVKKMIEHEKMKSNTSPCSSTLGDDKNGCQVIEPESFNLSHKEPLVNNATKLIVFVSFSMPEASLKTLFKACEENPNIRLVLRGFIDDSMEKTAKAIKALEGVVDIDPEIFERYQIEQVPTFLWVQGDHTLGKVSGNITVSYAHDLFAEQMKREGQSS